MINTFADAVTVLQRYIPLPGKTSPGEIGFLRMKTLVERLGNPQYRYPVIHVGGTSGKGSTATMIAAILRQKHQRIGLHTSPNLVSVTERMKINDSNIPEARFVQLANAVLPLVETLPQEEWGKPTYFEILTAMTFVYFAQEKVDVAVIEVGLGGRFDATNIVQPKVAVITTIGLDHTEILGDTIEKIAAEKAGIIKKGSKVVSGVTQPTVQEIIIQRCKDTPATLSLLQRDFQYQLKKIGDFGSMFDYQGNTTVNTVSLPLLGEHQVQNAVLAIRAVEEMLGKTEQLEQMIKKALSSISIPGRMEIIQHNPMIILDGAHNGDKMQALVHTMGQVFPNKRVVTMVAIKRGKHVEEMIEPLLHISQEYILTSYDLITEGGETISYTPEELAAQIHRINPTASLHRCPDPQEAFRLAKTITQSDDVLLVTGSLYLVGEIKKLEVRS